MCLCVDSSWLLKHFDLEKLTSKRDAKLENKRMNIFVSIKSIAYEWKLLTLTVIQTHLHVTYNNQTTITNKFKFIDANDRSSMRESKRTNDETRDRMFAMKTALLENTTFEWWFNAEFANGLEREYVLFVHVVARRQFRLIDTRSDEKKNSSQHHSFCVTTTFRASLVVDESLCALRVYLSISAYLSAHTTTNSSISWRFQVIRFEWMSHKACNNNKLTLARLNRSKCRHRQWWRR